MTMHLNERAARVADRLVADAEALGVAVSRVAGARVVDAGVEVPASLGAGLMLARVCLADLGSVAIVPGRVGQVALPSVAVRVDHPVAACMASQYAGWRIKVDEFFAMASGPMRAAAKSEDLFDQIGFTETPSCAVGVMEAAVLPGAGVIAHVAERSGVRPERLSLLVAPTASMAGGLQIVARSVETAMHKLHEMKFDLARIVGGFGVAPLPPVAADDLKGLGRTNDAILYGAEVTLLARGDDRTLAEAARRLPSEASADYGRPFAEVFKDHDHDFYKIDPMLFSPASVCVQNVQTGKSHRAGSVNEQVLLESFFG
jgi:methenyltetrahydromethanopterin cyclohydrolase